MSVSARARTSTAVRFDPVIYERLQAASEDHDRPVNWLVNDACRFFLDRLLPAEQIVLTTEHPSQEAEVAP